MWPDKCWCFIFLANRVYDNLPQKSGNPVKIKIKRLSAGGDTCVVCLQGKAEARQCEAATHHTPRHPTHVCQVPHSFLIAPAFHCTVMEVGGVVTYEGSNCFRQRLILSTLSGKPVRIRNIRPKADDPGLRGEPCTLNLRLAALYPTL